MKRLVFLAIIASIAGQQCLQAMNLFKTRFVQAIKYPAATLLAGSTAVLASAAMTSNKVHATETSPAPFGLGMFSKPLQDIWFRGIKERGDFVVIEHRESGKTIHLEARQPLDEKGNDLPPMKLTVSSAERRDKPYFLEDSKIIIPADRNRKIADIRWSSIYNDQTSGPILEIDSAMDCRVQQMDWNKYWERLDEIPTMHMRCVRRDTQGYASNDPEHNFNIYRVSAPKALPLTGELSYHEDNTVHQDGYMVQEKSHEFRLSKAPKGHYE